MKKYAVLIVALITMVFLAACGTNDNNNDGLSNPQNDANQNEGVKDNTPANDSQDNNTTNSTEGNTNNTSGSTDNAVDMNEKMKDINFAEIEIEIDYGNDQEYEAEVEKGSSGNYKAKVEDELSNTYLKGDEAFEHLYPLLQDLDITSDTSKEDMISAILTAFDLEDNYEEFDVEVIFHDGKKVEYEDKK